MMSEAKLSTSFPSNKSEALTILYLQTQNLKDISPEALVQKYNEAYKIISKQCQSSYTIMKKSDLGL